MQNTECNLFGKLCRGADSRIPCSITSAVLTGAHAQRAIAVHIWVEDLSREAYARRFVLAPADSVSATCKQTADNAWEPKASNRSARVLDKIIA